MTSTPVSSWMRKSNGGLGTDVDSQEAPHTLFRVSQSVSGPFTWTSFTEPRFATSCAGEIAIRHAFLTQQKETQEGRSAIGPDGRKVTTL